jgi:hypothetical protein
MTKDATSNPLNYNYVQCSFCGTWHRNATAVLDGACVDRQKCIALTHERKTTVEVSR